VSEPKEFEPVDPRVMEYLRTHCGPHSYGEQDENGVDLSLIRSSLRQPPLERLRMGDKLTSDVIWIQSNVKRILSEHGTDDLTKPIG
jgi:hypothetical protein